jgi:hypothetical protein
MKIFIDMNFKTIITVIITAIIIGVLIVYAPKILTKNINSLKPTNSTQKSVPPTTPTPTLPPVQINESSDLKEEINKIQIPDFSKDFESLKQELK